MKYCWALDINENLVEALATWSEFLEGKRDPKDTGVGITARYLCDEGFGIFTNPIPAETFRKLGVLAGSADSLKSDMANPTVGPKFTKRVGAFEKVLAEVNKEFFENELGITLLAENPADDPAKYSEIVAPSTNTLQDVLQVCSNDYGKPADILAGVGQGLDRLYDTVPADPANDYSKVPDQITSKTVSANEYAVVGRDVKGNEALEYCRPPPPETDYEARWDAAKGGI